MSNFNTSIQARQRGVVLVISLLMLLVLTVLGLAATRSTALEERMTANQNDKEVAFQAAEASLRYCEGLLSAASQPNFTANANGAYITTSMADTITWQDISWDSSPSNTATEPYGNGVITNQSQILILTGTGAETSIQAPRYFIVYDPNASHTQVGSTLSTDQQLVSKNVYYIYARGWGMTSGTYVTLKAVDTF